MDRPDDWSGRRPSSNILDYAANATEEDHHALARMPSQMPATDKQPRFYAARTAGKASAAHTHQQRPRPINTPLHSASHVPTMPMPIPIPANPHVIPGNTLPSAPASPPTPAPSPTPMQRAPDWSTADPSEDIGDLDLEDPASAASSTRGYGFGYRHMRAMFADMDTDERQRMLAELLNMCDGKLLGFVAGFVGPRLKRDPFSVLPNELCLRILTFIEDARTLARSSQVSRRWRELVSDDMAWKSLCERHAYRRMSEESQSSGSSSGGPRQTQSEPRASLGSDNRPTHPYGYSHNFAAQNHALAGLSSSAPDLTRRPSFAAATPASILPPTLSAQRATSKRRAKPISYRSHFKQRYQVETAWRTGGHVDTRQITPDQGVVTSLHLTSKYIIVALDNAKIHVFDTQGCHLRCLQGHVMGVWAMVPWNDTLVSGGCDRDVRVWDLSTGQAMWMLRGHTSTVRCLKITANGSLAISGSRDTTLRIWDLKKGLCRHVLLGHQASVRCLEIHGDLVVSGSYDTTARIWSISEGRCLRTLQGHFSQIYAIAFDGRRVATGSLDTSVRVWDPHTGRCLAQLQGHTSLVGQLQLRGDTLVTGGSDGSVRVWSLVTYAAVHRLAAHDNSVTSLQFDDGRIVSGGSDGRVKVWDLERGVLVRELGSPAEAVWRVVFEEERAVVLASRGGKTVMEVWSFAPPPEAPAHSTPASPRHSSDRLSEIVASPSSPLPPYQIGAYGDRASSEALSVDAEALQDLNRSPVRQEASRSQGELGREQDAVMTDAYSYGERSMRIEHGSTENEDGGAPIVHAALQGRSRAGGGSYDGGGYSVDETVPGRKSGGGA
ncbi:hypothetical protein LTR08_006705 [Meristemomyces frigidus]|nr:hypothetical protein LTR08_006705 [Meristemomyces frigidus]